MAYATHIRAGCMGTQHVDDVLAVESRLRYDDQWVMTLRSDGI